jgi:hypothetical protein
VSVVPRVVLGPLSTGRRGLGAPMGFMVHVGDPKFAPVEGMDPEVEWSQCHVVIPELTLTTSESLRSHGCRASAGTGATESC